MIDDAVPVVSRADPDDQLRHLFPAVDRLLGSGYQRAAGGWGPTALNPVIMALHFSLFFLGAVWMTNEIAGRDAGLTQPILILSGSTFLWIAPMAVALWETRFPSYLHSLNDDRTLDQQALIRLNVALDHVARWRVLVVCAPIALIIVANLTASDALLGELGLPSSGVARGASLVILGVGGLAAGRGTLLAVVTIFVALVITRHRADFSPYAGTTSRSSRRLGEFCFSTALLFGTAAAVIAPCLCAAAWAATGLPRLALMGTVAMILVLTSALLAVPATVLSRRSEDERVAYLDDLSQRIDMLAARVIDDDHVVPGEDYLRLEALLEMRSHVVSQTVAPASIDLVKRIPVAVLLPAASVSASWLSLVAS